MARYYSEDTWLFAALRLDDDYLETLDSFMRRLLPSSPELGLVVPSLSDLIRTTPGAADVLSWAGDYAAIGIRGNISQLQPNDILIVLEVDNPVDARSFMRAAFPDAIVYDSQGITSLFDLTASVYILDDYLLLYPGMVTVFALPDPTSQTLESNRSFTNLFNALPESGYNGLVFADMDTLSFIPALSLQPIIGSELTPIMIGLTTLDNTTLILDTVSLPVPGPIVAIPTPTPDLDFLRFVPANASAFVLANSPTNLIDSLLSFLDRLLITQNSRASIVNIFNALGIDFERDVLKWMTGDYAAFLRVEMVPLVQDFTQPELDAESAVLSPEENIDFGLVIDASPDPGAAQRLAARLGSVLDMSASASDGIVVRNQIISGQEVTLITLQSPLAETDPNFSDFRFSIALGATNEVFFIATPAYAESIITGGPSIQTSLTYTSATSLLLPDASSIWYTDRNGAVLAIVTNPFSLLFSSLLIGPAVSNVFDDVTSGLSMDGMQPGAPKMLAQPVPPTPDLQDLQQQVQEQVQAAVSLLGSMLDQIAYTTMSASFDAQTGISRLRMTLSLID